ncbi:hypothetical protein ACLB2K_068429 [Fragaria x ananassa]
MDDPSYTCLMASRELPYGYEVLIENLMDPAHAPYAHYGIMPTQEPEEKADREGGRPMDLHISKLDINGFTVDDQNSGQSKYVPACLFYSSLIGPIDNSNGAALSGKLYGFVKQPGNGKVSATSRALLVFFCVPVSPGYSRLITTHPINFGLWVKIRPRWQSHTRLNLILDSDLYLLHLEGDSNLHNFLQVPVSCGELQQLQCFPQESGPA